MKVVDSASANATIVSTLDDAVGVTGDPEVEDDAIDGEDEVKEALSRPPPINSDYLPLPWKGRIGYV